jgi:hypothetical protein
MVRLEIAKKVTSIATIFVFLLTQPLLGFAQGAGASSVSSSDGQRPDVVRTIDDSVIRGVIEEKLTGEFVLIRSPRGRVYEFAWDEIRFVGTEEEYEAYLGASSEEEAHDQVFEPNDGTSADSQRGSWHSDSPETTASEGSSAETPEPTVESDAEEADSIRFYTLGETPQLQIDTMQEFTQEDRYGNEQTNVDWKKACTTECTMEASEIIGRHIQLSFSEGGSGSRDLVLPSGVTGDVGISYQSRRPQRIGLGIGGLLAVGAGIGMVVLGRQEAREAESLVEFSGNEAPKFSKVGKAGFFPLTSGAVMMIIAAALKDKVEIRYEGGALEF